MKDDSISYATKFTESGFIFAPFNIEEKAILFQADKADYITEKLNSISELALKNDFYSDESSKEKHIKIVEKAIDLISENELQKVVISRKELVEIASFDVLEIYLKLLQTYANAFVYVWFHPKVGLWFGATPETLLQIESTAFKTMSLAGTQVANETENIVWKSKELEEQQLVTDFIKNQLNGIATDLKIDKTETIKAGNLLHLRTKVIGVLNKNANLKTLIRALHPTPAVCGLPREIATGFINKNESYNREFYTGFLGELNIKNSNTKSINSNLFVNLRCMKIEGNVASIYVGGGITKDSIAKKEWEETVSKSKTMKRVL
ncbi:chorismate-binding protein [Polaribacter pectinis]|uniref:isochorismate synthase n=2 Tax=Polaribacter pectinis TaxID=2738844 RepID=A0A7G9LEM0_9FLAO|nr:chorismate-binding protein [Polaribacter pectinis]